MRSGGGNPKGAAFERYCCKRLSLWLTKGQRDDCMWRTAMSGGRATFQLKQHIINSAQAGDINAISAEAMELCERCLFECKHYKDLGFSALVTNGGGLLAGFWLKVKNDAIGLGKTPVLIARQNRYQTLLLIPIGSQLFESAIPRAIFPVLGAEAHSFEAATTVVRPRRKRPNILMKAAE